MESGGVLDPMDPVGRFIRKLRGPEWALPYMDLREVYTGPYAPLREMSQPAPEEDRLAMAVSLGIAPAEVPLCRYVPIDFYIDLPIEELHTDYLMTTMARLANFCSLCGFEIVRNAEVENGSARWRPTLRTRRRYTVRQAEERKQEMAIMLAAALHEKAKESGKTKLQCDYELQKLIAETAQAKAETFKARAEGAKALAEMLLKAVAGVSLLLGTLHFIARPVAAEPSGEPAKVVSMKLVDPRTAFQIWSGDEHRDIVFVQDGKGLEMVSVEPPEAGGDDDEGP